MSRSAVKQGYKWSQIVVVIDDVCLNKVKGFPTCFCVKTECRVCDWAWIWSIPFVSLWISVTLVKTDLCHKLTDAGDNDCEDQAVKRDHEKEEGRIVVLANAGSQPDAVMVKLTDTIITDVAVGALRRAKDQTCLTVFHCGDC